MQLLRRPDNGYAQLLTFPAILMGRVIWLLGGAFATAACLCRWEAPGAAAAMTVAQVGTSVFVGKLPLFGARAARWRLLDSPISWGGAQFGFLLATYLWELAFGFAGGETTWIMSIAGLFAYYALARVGCLQANCCRAAGLRVDSRLVEIGLSVGALLLFGWLLQSGASSRSLKYLALALLAGIRVWSLLVSEQRWQAKLESSGFFLTAAAFAARDCFQAS
jgi:hypothetical protein